MNDFARDDDIQEILQETETIAVVGLSEKTYRPSYGVSKYLQSRGYRIIPVNPNYDSVLGETCYPSLIDVPEPVKTVNVFRNPEYVMPVVDEAIEIGAKYLWLQEQVVHEEAAQKAQNAGLTVVMNRCMLKEHRRFGE
ncbi:MAG: CoA-binding protein [Candidatus Marinimicrobia bacterium]|nr:CoA-binding protein [Candidatus Neomarinimicrobiota bacterium]MCF7829018.1 CoA-binding protein [Candidatus Neomarinimicrobiota bacterium]MCF7879978.1 CoA-binding protein [Candidatus Neomarinimicrobiota bacterium]